MSFDAHRHGQRFAIDEERRESRFREIACYVTAALNIAALLTIWLFFDFSGGWKLWFYPLMAMVLVAQAQFCARDRRKAEQRLRDWDRTVGNAVSNLFDADVNDR